MIEVVIPARNAGRFLKETLESVASQTRRPERVTVVDDRSTDDTVAVAEACRSALADRVTIRVIRNAGPRGPSAGRNTAIRESSAEWIALLDADDLYLPNHHETLTKIIDGVSDAVLSFGDYKLFRDGLDGARQILSDSFFAVSGVAGMSPVPVGTAGYSLEDDTFPALLRHGLFGTSACIFRRDAAIEAGLFDEAMMFSEDTDFFLRMALRGRFVFSHEFTTLKRVHDSNLSTNSNVLSFGHGTVVSYHKLATQMGPLVMTAQQRVLVKESLQRVMKAYLWNASLRGVSNYIRAAKLAMHCGYGYMAFDPRHWVRLCKYGVFVPYVN